MQDENQTNKANLEDQTVYYETENLTSEEPHQPEVISSQNQDSEIVELDSDNGSLNLEDVPENSEAHQDTSYEENYNSGIEVDKKDDETIDDAIENYDQQDIPVDENDQTMLAEFHLVQDGENLLASIAQQAQQLQGTETSNISVPGTNNISPVTRPSANVLLGSQSSLEISKQHEPFEVAKDDSVVEREFEQKHDLKFTPIAQKSAELLQSTEPIISQIEQDQSLHENEEQKLPDFSEGVVEGSNQLETVNSIPELANLQQKTHAQSEEADINSISSFLNVESNILASIDTVILAKLQEKVTEFNDLKSDKILLEVNLENTSHLLNKKIDLFKSQLNKSQALNNDLREKITSLERSKVDAETRLTELESRFNETSSRSSKSLAEINEIQEQRRKTFDLLEKKNNELAAISRELDESQNQNSVLRKNLLELETSNQSSNSSYIHSQIKIQSLDTQLDLVKKNNEWLNGELNQITSDYTQFRKDKSLETTNLQLELDQKVNELKSLTLKHENLSDRFTEASKKLDDSLLKIKTLSDEISLNKEEFFKEISIKDRLVSLLKSSQEGNKAKIQELENYISNSKSVIGNKSAVLQTTIDEYKLKLEEAEAKIEHLQSTIDELSVPIERSDPNSSISSAILSPSAKTIASKIPGTSLTQLYHDYSLLKKQLILERRAKERMQQQIDAFIDELERKSPLINAGKEKVEFLQEELTELSIILENTSKEKDTLQKLYNESTKDLQNHTFQIASLNKQKVDLARQVQTLICQVTIRGDANGPLTPAEKQALERISKGDKVLNESDTDILISERLVTFRNITELQAKNEELLRITRELGSRLEAEEKTSKAKLESLENDAIEEAKEAILSLQDEIKSTETQLNSVTRERDIFRAIASNKGSSGNILTDDLSSQSISNTQHNDTLGKQYEQAQREIKEAHDQLKQIKVEYETTISLLNKQISSLSSERSELSINLARSRSSNELIEERYKSLQENLKYSKSELDELRKRSDLLQESLTKQDLRTQQAAEELIQTKSLVESLRSETLNLKAEKHLWQTIEKRLNEENQALIQERSRLNSLLLSVQTLEKEREDSANDSHRRLLNQTHSLELELTSVRSRLNDSSVELKDVLSKKDADSYAYQERIDSLRSELSSTREELIVKKGDAEQLQSKVDFLTTKLKSTESQLKGYQTLSSESINSDPSSNEAFKLKKQLEDTKLELEEANQSIIKFKSISAATEEALNSINGSFDSYKETTNTKIAELETEKDGLIKKDNLLETQLNTLTEELAKTKATLSKDLENSESQISLLKSQLVHSSKLKEDYDAKVSVIEESYKQQVAIANEAQRNYDKELQKHAEVSKAVSLLREESNEFKSQIQALSAAAQRAKDELAQSKESWGTQRVDLEEELRSAKERVQDLTSQNHLLYNQIDSLTNQISSSKSQLKLSEDDNSSSYDDLRELIVLLRREKEISDAQLDITDRDLKRIRQQYEITNNELSKVKLELDKLKIHQSESDRLSKEHTALLNEIQQLNLLRESNTTLRSELHSNVARVKELETKLDEAYSKVQPLETQVVQLTAEIQSKGQEIKLVIEEKDRWKQRSQDILSKYDRIDPQEHSKLKVEVDELRSKNEETTKSLDEGKQKFVEISDRFERVKKEAQEKLHKRAAEFKTLTAQFNESEKQLKELKDLKEKSVLEISNLNEQLKSAKDSESKSTVASTELTTVKTQLADAEKQLAEKSKEISLLKEAEAKYTALSKIKDELDAKVKSLERDVTNLKKELEAAKDHSTKSASAAPVDNSELIKAKQELSKQRDESKKFKDQLTHQVQQANKAKDELAKQVKDLKSKLNASSNKDAPNKDASNKDASLKEQAEKLRKEFDIELKNTVEKELESLKSRLRQPTEEKIQRVTEARVAKLEEELKKKYDEAHAELENKAKSDNSKVDEALLAEIKKKSFDEGRAATMKEVQMRSKLLQGKVEKTNREKKELEEQKKKLEKELAKLKSPEATVSVPSDDTNTTKVSVAPPPDHGPTTATTAPAATSTSTNTNTSKPNPSDTAANPSASSDIANSASISTNNDAAGTSQKRPAEDEGDSPEKKIKS
ncbi:hypothetical protein WICMUC_005575 [Wickerhamomyces mucosus]|uniref:Nucleoprotein TPR/MLP1 domain-containing protein n=1 Tax=Wickerhamomyces mucosus TaxID=1378264 RepID=A0A9P8T645_9ASCO|nr:hypothetical protein WICMUC_005575 [Wickerhamomyces mucosus]